MPPHPRHRRTETGQAQHAAREAHGAAERGEASCGTDAGSDGRCVVCGSGTLCPRCARSAEEVEIARLQDERDRLRAELAEACELLDMARTDISRGMTTSETKWRVRRDALIARVRGR